eukprot:jgi/Chlat1/3270/Chrsp22S00256
MVLHVDLEAQRRERVEANKQKLRDLQLLEHAESLRKKATPPRRNVQARAHSLLAASPVRTSSRFVGVPKVNYAEKDHEYAQIVDAKPRRGGRRNSKREAGSGSMSWNGCRDFCTQEELDTLRNGQAEVALHAAMKYIDDENLRRAFAKKILPSHVSKGYWMALPAEFATYLPKGQIDEQFPVMMRLREVDFPMKFIRKGANGGGLSGGWRHFAGVTQLRTGDAVLCYQPDPSAFTYQMEIIRAGTKHIENVKLLTEDSDGFEDSDSPSRPPAPAAVPESDEDDSDGDLNLHDDSELDPDSENDALELDDESPDEDEEDEEEEEDEEGEGKDDRIDNKGEPGFAEPPRLDNATDAPPAVVDTATHAQDGCCEVDEELKRKIEDLAAAGNHGAQLALKGSHLVAQSIRVYWPEDQKWYKGVVVKFDAATCSHHIKYEDDECIGTQLWDLGEDEKAELILPKGKGRLSSSSDVQLKIAPICDNCLLSEYRRLA